jgi:DNA adenine methylase
MMSPIRPRSQRTDAATIIPFLKWAGGKRWLASRYAYLFPDTFNRYLEPFLGSGAVFFHLNPRRATLSDSNRPLMDTYAAVRNNPDEVFRLLALHQKRHSYTFYYQMRKAKPTTPARIAARFIYLNRTCWNGLYRVNKTGEFNVPLGTKDSVLFDTDNFSQISDVLKQATIACCDFEKTIGTAREGDFIFIDPPYTAKHNMNGFLKYNESIFTWNDQLRLAKSVKAASDRGVKILVTNANHVSLRKIYRGMGTLQSLTRQSILAADSARRTSTTELAVVINYEIKYAPLIPAN